MVDENIKYELRTIKDSDYASHADLLFLYFTNGIRSGVGPAGHSDERKFSSGDVVCRLREEDDGTHIEGLAEVIEFSEDGRPIKFGNSINNRSSRGRWEPPKEADEIIDKRK